MAVPARVAIQTFHQPTNQPSNQPTNQPTAFKMSITPITNHTANKIHQGAFEKKITPRPRLSQSVDSSKRGFSSVAIQTFHQPNNQPTNENKTNNNSEQSCFTVCFTVCFFISPDLDGNQGTKNETMCPERPTEGPETQIRSHSAARASKHRLP
jgi:hypothetical protein